jgi:hypothetical protein
MSDPNTTALGLNLTPLRRRVLGALEQRGAMKGQDLGYEFATPRRELRGHQGAAFKAPQAATRWAAAFMAPMVKATLARQAGPGLGGEYQITDRGKDALRHG